MIFNKSISKQLYWLCITIFFLLVGTSFESYAAIYSAEPIMTETGDSHWDKPILKLETSISGSIASFTVTKGDNSVFISSGDMYLKVGTPEKFGVNHGVKPVYQDITTSVTFIDNLDNYPANTFPKNFYARYENTDKAWAWVGPITIERSEITQPTGTVYGSLTVSASATDAEGLQKVSVVFVPYGEPLVLCEDGAANPCSGVYGSWSVNDVNPADYGVTAYGEITLGLWVRDDNGEVRLATSETIDWQQASVNDPPQGTISLPEGLTLGNITVSASATDTDGLKKVSAVFVPYGKPLVLCEDGTATPCTGASGQWAVTDVDPRDFGASAGYINLGLHVQDEANGNDETLAAAQAFTWVPSNNQFPTDSQLIHVCVGNNYEQQIPVDGVQIPTIAVNGPSQVNASDLIELTADAFVDTQNGGKAFFFWCAERGKLIYDDNNPSQVKFQAPFVPGFSEPVTIMVQVGDGLGYVATDVITIDVIGKLTKVIHSSSGVIQQDETIPLPIDLGDYLDRLVAFVVKWPGSDIDLIPSKPDGAAFNYTDANVFGYYEGRTQEYYIFYNDKPGQWGVDLIGKDIDPNGEPYELIVYTEDEDAFNTTDTDNDGIADAWEIGHFGNLDHDAYTDADNDGLNDYAEFKNGTDPLNPDSDYDGIPDGWEVDHGLNPLANDANEDPDNDGFTNLQEYLNNTDPTDPDSFYEPQVCDRPIDLVYLVDFSGSMEKPFAGSGTRMQAARQAIASMNAALAKHNGSNRAAMITFGWGENDPENVMIRSEFTTDYGALDELLEQNHSDQKTNTASGLAAALDYLTEQRDPAHLPVVLLVTDGVANVDLQSYYYSGYLDDMKNIDLTDKDGNFLLPSAVRRMGKYYTDNHAHAGAVLADIMDLARETKARINDAIIYGVAIQGTDDTVFSIDSYYRIDILEYAADATGGRLYTADNVAGLELSLLRILEDSTCLDSVRDCKMYALHDDGSGQTRLLAVDMLTGAVTPADAAYTDLALQGMSIHPDTRELYATGSGQDATAANLYQIDPNTGELSSIGVIRDSANNGFANITALAFRPDGSLWGFAADSDPERQGVIRIDPETGLAAVMQASDLNVNALVWRNDGDVLFMAAGRRLYQYTADGITSGPLFSNLPGAIEGLTIQPDGMLLAFILAGGDLTAYALDIEQGVIPDAFRIDAGAYTNIQALAWPSWCGDAIRKGVAWASAWTGGFAPGDEPEKIRCQVDSGWASLQGKLTLDPPGSQALIKTTWQVLTPLDAQCLIGYENCTEPFESIQLVDSDPDTGEVELIVRGWWPGVRSSDFERVEVAYTIEVLDRYGNALEAKTATKRLYWSPEIECPWVRAVDDQGFAKLDTPSVINVLSNDDMPDGIDSVVIAIQTEPAHGVLVYNRDGTFFYTPENGYLGSDNFTYSIHDPLRKKTRTATVTIEVKTILPGDVNNDGRVDSKDAVLMLQVISGYAPGEPVFVEADVNDDGKLGLEDLAYIMEKSAKVR